MSIPKLFELNTIVVNEKVGMFKMANAYLLQDEQANEIGFVQENLSFFAKMLRLFVNKAMLPFELHITDENKTVVARIKRGFTLFMSKVQVFDGNDKLIGTFQGKFKFMGSRFEIQDENGTKVGEINGDWKGWDFKITNKDNKQIGSVNKKWAGALKEIFTTADRYKVEINPEVAEDEDKVLIVSVAIAVDMILKESK
jgi:uncharacterized protein YxjI